MSKNPYEEDQILHDYILFHYGKKEDILSDLFPVDWALDFPVKCITESLPEDLNNRENALDIGCSVGRSSFELSKHFKNVVGVDYSHSFIKAANKMKLDGQYPIRVKDHGSIYSHKTLKSPEACMPDRITFEQGDACNLKKNSKKWDFVLAANLLCRIPDPRKFLEEISFQINSGGILALVSPYTWMTEYTSEENWIGGTDNSSSSKDAIKSLLYPSFELIKEQELPFLIREHRRKYQLSSSHSTVWRKK